METFNRRAITLLSSSIVSARFTDTSKGPPVKGATVIQTRPPPKESLWLRGVAVDGGAVAAKGQLLTTPLLPAAAVVFSWPPAVAVSSARVSRSGNMASALFPGSSLYLSLPKPLIPQACCCCCCLRCRTETEERAGRGGGLLLLPPGWTGPLAEGKVVCGDTTEATAIALPLQSKVLFLFKPGPSVEDKFI